MGRPKLTEQKAQIAARVGSKVKAAIEVLTEEECRTQSQTIELLLKESPRIKAQLRKKSNGNGK